MARFSVLICTFYRAKSLKINNLFYIKIIYL
jgi:hypothetical protein